MQLPILLVSDLHGINSDSDPCAFTNAKFGVGLRITFYILYKQSTAFILFRTECFEFVQVLVEKSLVDAVGLEWMGVQGVALPSEPSSHLALRNQALLLYRSQSELATSKLASTTSFLSGLSLGL